MAEVAGIVLSAVGMVALVETVNDGFQRVAAAKNLGRDFENYTTQLAVAGLAFNRWRKSVRVTEPGTTVPGEALRQYTQASEEETAIVQRLLGNIQVAFEDAQAKENRYGVSHEEEEAPDAPSVNLPSTAILVERTRARAKVYQKANNVLNKVRWTFHDGEALKQLAASIDHNVGKLTQLFPAIQTQQQQLRDEDILDIAPDNSKEDVEVLEALKKAATKVDPIMSSTAEEAIKTRHQFTRNEWHNNRKTQIGDLNETGKALANTGPGHNFTDNKFDGNDVMLIGDRITNGDSGFFK